MFTVIKKRIYDVLKTLLKRDFSKFHQLFIHHFSFYSEIKSFNEVQNYFDRKNYNLQIPPLFNISIKKN